MDKFTVLNALGEADVAASANTYAKALTAWKELNEIATDRVETAVEAIFDRTPGSLPMPFLIDAAVNEISQDPAQFKTLSKRVRAYVKEQKQIGRLAVKPGKPGATGGGVSRLSRAGEPVPAPIAQTA